VNELQASILEAGQGEFWMGMAILTVMSLAAFFFLFRAYRRARIVEDTPTSKIRSAAQGYAEFQGQAEALPGEPTIAPLSQLHCLWYRYSIQERRTSHHKGRRRTRWVTLESGTSDDTFRLRDDTGDCVIDPDGASVTPSVSQTWYGSSRRPGLAPPGGGNMLIGIGRYKYSEQRIVPGPLYAIGRFHTLSTGGTDDREADIGVLLRAWKRDRAALLDEWQAARSAAEAQVDAKLRAGLSNTPISMVSRPEQLDRPYLLSVKPQADLVRRLRRRAALGLAGFLAGGAAVSWAVGIRLGG